MAYEMIKPLLFKLNPEHVHTLVEYSLRALSASFPGSLSFLAHKYIVDDESLRQNLLGLDFNNPVGLAGGFDKNATMIRPLSALGLAFWKWELLLQNLKKAMKNHAYLDL